MKQKSQRCTKRKPNNGLGNVKKKWRGAEERERKGSWKGGSCTHPAQRFLWRTGDLHLPADYGIYQGTWESKDTVLFVFFLSFFSVHADCTKASVWHADNALYPSFIRPVLQTCHHFSSLSLGPFSSFLRNDYLQTCYVKSYDIAHNSQALSNGPP